MVVLYSLISCLIVDFYADLSVTQSRVSYHSESDNTDLDLLIQACSVYEPADRPQEAHQGSQTDLLKQELSEQCK